MFKSAFSLLFDEPAVKGTDEVFFLGALKNARHVSGSTHPNPSVGAVIVKDGRIIANGHTEKPGCMHAEKQAIHRSQEDLQGTTLYVTLEPCCHTGRTPPCTDAIIKAGCARVVYGVSDPNPLVAGKGIKQLKEAGIVVDQIGGQLLERAQYFLKPFTSFITRKCPYVVAKIASSRDGAIALKGTSTKITSTASDMMVHELRRSVDAVMVGGATVRIDNPRLTARLGEPSHGQQPIRIIVTKTLDFDPHAVIFKTDDAPTWIFCPDDHFSRACELKACGVEIIKMPDFSLRQIFYELGKRGLTSILVEPGKILLKALLADHLIDELWWFQAPQMIGQGGLSVCDELSVFNQSKDALTVGDDELRIHSFGLHDF